MSALWFVVRWLMNVEYEIDCNEYDDVHVWVYTERNEEKMYSLVNCRDWKHSGWWLRTNGLRWFKLIGREVDADWVKRSVMTVFWWNGTWGQLMRPAGMMSNRM